MFLAQTAYCCVMREWKAEDLEGCGIVVLELLSMDLGWWDDGDDDNDDGDDDNDDGNDDNEDDDGEFWIPVFCDAVLHSYLRISRHLKGTQLLACFQASDGV